jgi:dynein heavy chain
MTDDINQAKEQILKGFVPELWKKISYPSLKPLASYIVDLVLRMKTL